LRNIHEKIRATLANSGFAQSIGKHFGIYHSQFLLQAG
jgi:hypothetical protein